MKVKIAFPKNLYFGSMGKYLVLLCFVILISGCKNERPEEVEEEAAPEAFSFQNYPALIELEPDVLSVVDSWPEFMAMENSVSVLKRATNTEDLKLAIEDLIAQEKTLAEGDYPQAFDKLQIKSRQQVFRTFLYKIQGNLLDNRDFDEAMKQMIEAYNAYKNQFNVISGNTLDAKLILDEE
jgi:hypothetical protein